jgi:hypothetical protein
MLIVCQISHVRGSRPLVAHSNPHRRIPVKVSVDHLVLSLNAIESIPPLPKSDKGTDASASGGLAHIKSLTLSSNNLRSWADINALADHCPMLETLSITNNPIIEGQSRPRMSYSQAVPSPLLLYLREAQ